MQKIDEDAFLDYWTKNREWLATPKGKLMAGLPFALLFSLPILAFFIIVFLFFPDWFAKMPQIGVGTIITIVIALLLLTLFVAITRSHFRWEMNEQFYKELRNKRNSVG